MGELEKELRKISKTLNDLARKVDRVATKAVGRTKVYGESNKETLKESAGSEECPRCYHGSH